MTEKSTSIKLSVIATVYNGEQTVQQLVNEIENYTIPLNIEYEIILVNDYSPDRSEQKINEICKQNEKVKGISLSRNYGQQLAMSIGMRYASGEYIVIMDGDLQNPTSAIPLLYEEIQQGYDIVYTVSKTRNNFFDELTSKFFWFLLINICKVNIVRDQLMLRIMKRTIVEAYNDYNEVKRSVAGILDDISKNYTILEVENNKRTVGKSNYNFIKRFNLMTDIVVSLTIAPLNFMIHLGWTTFLLTSLLILFNLVLYLCNLVPSGYTSIILSICFFGSLNVLLLGFIGKYMANIYDEVKRRPLFHIKNTYNL